VRQAWSIHHNVAIETANMHSEIARSATPTATVNALAP
jgi:hypothetical protein